MHILSLPVEVIGTNEVKRTHGIAFTSCAFVRIEVDGVDLLGEVDFEGTVLYFPELERTLAGSGRYLVFTCTCGIAEDAGWVEIDVVHRHGSISWAFEHGANYAFEFVATQYEAAIRKCRGQIRSLSEGITLVPKDVIRPTWSQK